MKVILFKEANQDEVWWVGQILEVDIAVRAKRLRELPGQLVSAWMGQQSNPPLPGAAPEWYVEWWEAGLVVRVRFWGSLSRHVQAQAAEWQWRVY